MEVKFMLELLFLLSYLVGFVVMLEALFDEKLE